MKKRNVPFMAILLSWSGTACAQLSAAPVNAGTPAPETDPTRLPGDMGPAPLARMLRQPRPGPTAPTPSDTTVAPSAAIAIMAARAAIAACERQGLRIGVAVTDAAGNLRFGLSADGALPGLVFVAARKAGAAAAFGVPTSVVQERLRHDPSAMTTLKPYMAVWPGGVPLLASGKLIGAMGGSGATAQQDEACVMAGAASVQTMLERNGK